MKTIKPDTPLVCLRVAALANPPVRSRKSNCVLCGAPVWMALSSPDQPVLWCWECAGVELAKVESIEAVMTERQQADVAAYRARRHA